MSQPAWRPRTVNDMAGRWRVAGLAASVILAGVGFQAGVASVIQGRADAYQFVTEQRLLVALQTFRPSDRSGAARRMEPADLAPERSVRSDPARCAPLVLLATEPPRDAATWSGINGTPAQPVMTLTARYADAAGARRAVREKRAALLACRTIRLTFPPFDQPAQEFTPADRRIPSVLVGDRLSFALEHDDSDRYAFYVRRYGNTVTWTYGRPAGDQVRRQVVDDLADRLGALSRE